MALDTNIGIAPYDAPEKDLYEVGEMPPLGHVPKQMYAAFRPIPTVGKTGFLRG